jgi:hypothetical protein
MGQLRVVEVWLWGVEGEDGLVWVDIALFGNFIKGGFESSRHIGGWVVYT